MKVDRVSNPPCVVILTASKWIPAPSLPPLKVDCVSDVPLGYILNDRPVHIKSNKAIKQRTQTIDWLRLVDQAYLAPCWAREGAGLVLRFWGRSRDLSTFGTEDVTKTRVRRPLHRGRRTRVLVTSSGPKYDWSRSRSQDMTTPAPSLAQELQTPSSWPPD